MMSDLALKLISQSSSDQEVFTLQELYSALSAKKNGTVLDNGLVELAGNGVNIDLFGDGNPFPGSAPEIICPSQDCLNRFTCYVFERRFGWSETDTEDGRRVRHMSCSGGTMSAGTSKQKATINTLLDCLIKWFMHQDLSIPLLKAFKFTILQTASMPVVRNRAVIHTLDWWKSYTEQLCEDRFFPEIKELLLLSVTDVWSAIRNACASRLSTLSASLNMHHMQILFDNFIQICEEDYPWQKKEGSIMGINALLHRFMCRANYKSPMSSPRTLDINVQENRVPDFISEKIHSVVYKLLSHSQLTIREHAVKTLATYITCATVADALVTLDGIIQTLKTSPNSLQNSQETTVRFLDDYAAEGFLGVCIFLVKEIPLNYLLPGWPEYISTFLLYLSHPASTVRQAASTVFKYLVAKCSHSVLILKLILQALAMGWNPNTDHMTAEMSNDFEEIGEPSPSITDYEGLMPDILWLSGCLSITIDSLNCRAEIVIHDKAGQNLCDTWEGREGRMFAYELIFKYLIKNHWLYTFGPAGSAIPMEAAMSSKDNEDIPLTVTSSCPSQGMSSPRGMPHVESEKSLSVKFLSQAEFKDESREKIPWKKMQRMMTIDERDDKAFRKNQFNGVVASEGMTSLLTQAQIVDNGDNSTEMGKEDSKQKTQLNKLRLLLENGSVDSIQCTWMEKENLQDMSKIFKVILYQTCESLGHSQWELRRIANQVLPCLAEVIRWYDINLLITIWNSYLNVAMPTCLMTFASVLLLKESVLHAVRLMPLVLRPPHTWQDYERCKGYLSTIINTIQCRCSTYLPHLQFLIQRASFDKLSVISTDVMLISYQHLAIKSDQKQFHYLIVLEMWRILFHFAHPHTRISTEFFSSLEHNIFVSPSEGYLSCCLVKPENKMQCAKQVEKSFITEIFQHIPNLLDELPTPDMLAMTPIVVFYIGQFVEDSHISKKMLDCLQNSVPKIVNCIYHQTGGEMKMYLLKCILNTLKEISAIVALKSVELPQVQKLLIVYEELCKPVNLDQHMSLLLSRIASRLSETVEFFVDNTGGQPSSIDDLYLMSNDIPTSENDSDLNEDSTDSEEIIVGSPMGNRFPESLTLNTSNNSGTLTACFNSLSVQNGECVDGESSKPREGSDNEADDSDWDSWDEEDNSQSDLRDVFSEFLRKFQISHKREFMAEIKKLNGQEKTVISGLLKG